MNGINGLLDSSGIISFCFLDGNGKILKSMNYQLPLIPASNMKLVTTISAMEQLGSNFKFATKFTTEERKIRISGDPAFFLNYSRFKGLVRETGLDRPETIIFENPSIDDVSYNSHWSYGDSNYSYQAKITNFFINENCIIKNDMNFDEGDYDYIHQNEELFSPLKKPVENFLNALGMERKDVRVRNIKGNGNETDKGLLYEVPLKDVERHILYESCNFYAEVLFKYLSGSLSAPGTWEKTASRIKDLLSKITGSENIRVTDGSGLSKDNLLTTQFLSYLLLYAKNTFGINYIDLLPAIGLGTLRNRLSSLKEYRIYAKTGTLTGVSSLSGYISSLDVEFSIIVNNSLSDSKVRQEKIDTVLTVFIKEYEKNCNKKY